MKIDFRKDKSKSDGTDNINNGVKIGHYATGTSKSEADNHRKLKNNANGFVFDVFRKNDGSSKKDCGDNHDMSGREARLARTVGASWHKIKKLWKEFVEN